MLVKVKTGFRMFQKTCSAISVGLNKNQWYMKEFAMYKHYTWLSGQTKEEIQTQSHGMGERKVFVDGINLNVREEGEGPHNVLCLPGLVGTIETDFGHIFKLMDTSKFRLICWDPPGYGKSRPPNRKHSPDFYLDDAKIVARLMDILGYKRYSILGWSNGGITGYTLAALFPQRVTKIVFWGAHAYMDEKVLGQGYLVSDTKHWSPKLLKLMENIYGRNYLESVLTDFGESVMDYLNHEGHVVQERIAAVQCPALVLHGMKDKIIPLAHVKYFEENLRQCMVRFFSEGKHDLHITYAQEFLKEVEAFLLNST